MNYVDELRSAIREQNVSRARAMVLSLLTMDETAPEPQALRLAMEIAGKFTDPETPFFDQEDHLWKIPPNTDWDPALLRKIKAALLTNFSKEKLELAEQIIAQLRARGLPNYQVNDQATRHRDYEKNGSRSDFLAGAIVGGVVLGGVGLVIGLTAVYALKLTIGKLAIGGIVIGGAVIGGVAGGIVNRARARR